MGERKQLNTPVDGKALEAFRTTCKEYGLNMSTVLDAMLQDFVAGNYEIVISRDGMKVVKK